jgi:hypothetical protein
MSDLKHQPVEQLQKSKQECEQYISKLTSTLNGQRTRLEWIERYIFEKTPQELTIKQIENLLGHRVIIK